MSHSSAEAGENGRLHATGPSLSTREPERSSGSQPPASVPLDFNTQSTPAIATIGTQRLLIQGNADGSICAIQALTGKPVWRFRLSKRGLNTSVVVDGETVYASHSEENLAGGPMGAVVAIDAGGSGDVTETHERWRTTLAAGFSSPLLKDGKLLVVDNSANLHCLDASTGSESWDFSIGTVGKGSPVWADGKIFVTEVNGHFHILGLDDTGIRSLDKELLTVESGRYAEIYGSPAIAHGPDFFSTEGGLYSLGASDAAVRLDDIPAPPPIATWRGRHGHDSGRTGRNQDVPRRNQTVQSPRL